MTIITLPTVACDEAGNTGQNLLDPRQPVFALSSVHLSAEEAAEVVTRLRGPQRAEAQFRGLKRSEAGQRRIIEALNSPALHEAHVYTSIYHKPFMVTTKIVDLLVEPMHHDRGIDLYERGANLGLANMWHACMPVLLPPGTFDEMQRLFVAMIRTSTRESRDAFYAHVRALREALPADHSFRLDLGMLLATERAVPARAWDVTELDPAVPSFSMIGGTWTRRLDMPFVLLHDESKPIASQQQIIELMMSIEDQPIEIGYDRRKQLFPMRIAELRLVPSHAHPALELADLLASATAYAMRSRLAKEPDPFADELLNTHALQADVHMVWPSTAVSPAELGTEEVGGIDAVQYVADYVAEKKKL